MSSIVPLFARGEEVIFWIIVAILFFVVPGILQALGKQREEAQRRQAAPRPKPQPADELDDEIGEFLRRAGRPEQGAGQARPQPQPQARPADELEQEVSDFLRRAAERRGAEAPAPPRPRPAPKPMMPKPQPARPARPPRPALTEKPAAREPATPRPVGAGLADQVQKDLDTAEFRRRSARLGAEVGHVDERMESRLHEAFDHQLSQLETAPGETAAPPQVVETDSYADRITSVPTAPIGLGGLLGSGADLRRAIIVTEILRRPEHRWT